MLLDAPRFSRELDRRFPPGADGVGLGARVQRGLSRYVRGQATVSLVIGATVGISMELLGLLGIWPAARQYAIFFFAWATVTELIPYVGPVLGALPPIVLALLDSPLTALWVTLIFVAIHQLEGHIVVPRVMGSALGAHPLAVIFTLLAGAEMHGLFGALLALPLLAIGREIWLFFRDRVHFEPWPSMMLAGVGLDVSGQAPAAERPAGELPEGDESAT
jgi:predicted PurR-regulated permease PerM